MNRRSFFKRLFAGVSGLAAWALLPEKSGYEQGEIKPLWTYERELDGKEIRRLANIDEHIDFTGETIRWVYPLEGRLYVATDRAVWRVFDADGHLRRELSGRYFDPMDAEAFESSFPQELFARNGSWPYPHDPQWLIERERA